MVTCCPLSSNDDGDAAKFYSTAIRSARKEYRCSECDDPISRGVKHEHVTGLWDGQFSTYRTCLSCVEIRDHFACNGWLFGCLWEDLEQNFFPDMRMGGPCMEGLSPAAKLKLVERRMAWYLDQDEVDDSAWEDWPKHRDRQRPRPEPVEREEVVPYYESPEFYWKRDLEIEVAMRAYEAEPKEP